MHFVQREAGGKGMQMHHTLHPTALQCAECVLQGARCPVHRTFLITSSTFQQTSDPLSDQHGPSEGILGCFQQAKQVNNFLWSKNNLFDFLKSYRNCSLCLDRLSVLK